MGTMLDPSRLGEHLDRMYRAAWAMCGGPQDAEDLVQETCLRLLAKPRRIDDGDELGYLLAALRNTHINHHRARARRPRTVAVQDEVEVADGTACARPEERAREREVLAWVSQLPEDLAAAIVAVDVVGLGHRDAAASLGIGERELAHRLTRARISLAEKLEPVAARGAGQRRPQSSRRRPSPASRARSEA